MNEHEKSERLRRMIFDYTMTHQIDNQILIENFIRWPMNVTLYGDKHS
jgi:hypothetical protein